MTFNLKNYNTYFFFAVLAIISVATFMLYQPFLTAILVAGVLAALFQKPYVYLLKRTKGRESLSALITVLLIFFMIIIPVLAVAGLITNEVNNAYQKFSDGDSAYKESILNIARSLDDLPLFQSVDLTGKLEQKDIGGLIQNASQWLITIAQKTYQGIANFVLWVFVMFFSLYYFLIEGGRMLKRIMFLSPLKEDQEKLLIKRFISISKATLKGTVILGIIQGTLGGILFSILGVPSAVVWGVVMVVLSVIPLLGAGIVWFPAGVIMIVTGHVTEGIVILAFGAGVISTVDNILRPKLVGRDTQMHPLFVFFSTLGGIAVFGFTGFIIGPIIMALFLALWEIYAVEFKSQLEAQGN